MRPATLQFRLTAALLAVVGVTAAPAPAHGQDWTRAGRFDLGKMWTFENPPAAYFTSTYGFSADSAWFARARLAALRIPGCSAGLVSADGLIVTNHHCVRGRLASIARPGETLLDSGFVAPTLADERRIPGFYADQLVAAPSRVLAGDSQPKSGRNPAHSQCGLGFLSGQGARWTVYQGVCQIGSQNPGILPDGRP
jgi:hypothetical protein